jgi:hypothetical protein
MRIQVVLVDGEIPAEPTAWQDWVVLGYLCAVTLMLLTGTAYVMVRGRRYPPLRSKQVRKLLVMSACGIVQCWATLVANEELTLGERSPFVCSLLSFWLEYAVGLGGWICVLLVRVMDYAEVFHAKWRKRTPAQKARAKLRLCLWVLLPVVGLCVAVSAAEASAYEGASAGCTTQLPYKAGLAAWVLAQVLTLWVVNRYVSAHVSDAFFNEYAPLRDILALSVATVLANAGLNFLGMVSYAWGRSLFTALAATLHAFCFLRLYGYRMWKCWRRDLEYAQRFISSHAAYELRLEHLRELVYMPMLFEGFLEWCEQGGDRKAKLHAECYRALRSWEDDPAQQTEERRAQLVQTYFAYGSPCFVPFPSALMVKASTAGSASSQTFRACTSWLLDQMDTLYARSYFEHPASEEARQVYHGAPLPSSSPALPSLPALYASYSTYSSPAEDVNKNEHRKAVSRLYSPFVTPVNFTGGFDEVELDTVRYSQPTQQRAGIEQQIYYDNL